MWPHFKKLLWQSWLSLVQALGTTSLAIVVAIIGFFFVLVINLIFKLRKDGWSWSVTVSHFSQNLKDSLVPTVLGTCFLWAILYGTFVVRQVYYDHHNMAGRWQDVVTEKDNLKRGLQCRDAYITTREQNVSYQFAKASRTNSPRFTGATIDRTARSKRSSDDDTAALSARWGWVASSNKCYR